MKNILIIDDQLEILALLKYIIQEKFIVDRIDTCGTPEQAIGYYNTYKYDVVITDLNLKNKISGNDLYYILKEIYPSIIIVSSGSDRTKYPFDDIIYKPSQVSDIISVISKYVTSKTKN